MVYIDSYMPIGGSDSGGDLLTCGFSPMAILASLLAGVVLMLVAFSIGRFRLASAIPVAGSCSAAISAACHTSITDVKRPDEGFVKWGVIRKELVNEPGHCGFSAAPISAPVPNSLYAQKLD
jgi:hypothetical protein